MEAIPLFICTSWLWEIFCTLSDINPQTLPGQTAQSKQQALRGLALLASGMPFTLISSALDYVL